MKYAIKVKLPILKKHIPKKNKTFRIFTTHENKHIKPNRNLIKRLESKIISMTDLKLNLNYPNIEFYILSRTEGYGYFLMKLSKKQKTKPGKGELRRELAHMLCRISNPSDNDIFLDPFAGTGTIPKERIIIGPYMKIYVNDKERLINKSLRNYQNSKIIIMREDALNMSLYENSITHIVTDPPWGIFKELPMKIERFYMIGQGMDVDGGLLMTSDSLMNIKELKVWVARYLRFLEILQICTRKFLITSEIIGQS